MNNKVLSAVSKPADNLVKVSVSETYPTIEIANKNPKYAQLLSLNLASSKSEMTSVNQYIYESWSLRAEYPELADLMRRIGIVEMHHFNLLGEMIKKLGSQPRLQAFKQNRHIVWNGNMLHYAEKAKQLLRFNIVLEKTAIETYHAQAKFIKEGNISEILLQLAADEKLHLHIFEDYLKNI